MAVDMSLFNKPLADDVIERLHAKHKRKCHSIGSIFDDKTSIDGMTAAEKRMELMQSPFFRECLKHSKSQDALAGLVDLANFTIDAPAPDAVGEELVRRVEMTTETKKVRLRGRAKTSRTARGQANRGRGTRSTFVNLYPRDEIESHSSWDMNFLEDADWDVAMEESAGVTSELRIDTSQLIIDFLNAIPRDDLSAGDDSATALNFDELVDMRQTLKSKSIMPDCCLLNPLQVAKLLKEEVFQDSLKYGDLVNRSEGYIGMFMGMSIFETPQANKNELIMLEKANTALFGVRRYEMLDTYEEVQDAKKEYGVKVSTRYELKVGDAQFMGRQRLSN